MQFDATGVVSALRATSVVYAAIIGRVFLKEEVTTPDSFLPGNCIGYGIFAY
jgi:hypothetical protein